ncbi:hypothetical protein A6D6_01986 [Alcanivorax xiamenensis]|uniref:SpoIIAA-like n=1 Tax=Alcanivorax xiamenensis TaxID=1177156 RepID=A0ABQ6Y8J3_9GAMM|nr:STAS/SEC14 domain-containing protein [Alcanivorax xiamenensis]KAF0805930.1 hypothetical protein A6D6_01986 [Alcanivorax xiamenensis]
MLERIDLPDERIVGLRIDGRIDQESFDAVLADMERRLQQYDTLRVYVELEALGAMSLETLFKDLKFGLGHMSRFDKEAVVTDKQWLHRIGPVVNKLFPSVEVKVFATEEKGAALRWVRE